MAVIDNSARLFFDAPPFPPVELAGVVVTVDGSEHAVVAVPLARRRRTAWTCPSPSSP